MPFMLEDQKFFVWTASHVGMAPRAMDPKQPAIRIYGVFASAGDATEHAKVVHALDPASSVLVSETHKWLSIPTNPERIAHTDKVVERILAEYHANRQKSQQTFEDNVSKKRTGIGPEESVGGDKQGQGAAVELPPDATSTSARIGRDAEVRDQSIVAVSFVRDECVPSEPIFMVYAAFDSVNTGDSWARCAGDTVVDFDIDLCSTCSWLFPNSIKAEKITKEVFRSSELTEIIANQKKQPQECENFRKWREEAMSEKNPSTKTEVQLD